MGEVFEIKGNPQITFAVEGTAPINRLTLVRNEKNYKAWEPGTRKYQATMTDAEPLAGENRYYLRVEQSDGNMAWSSPVWATIKK